MLRSSIYLLCLIFTACSDSTSFTDKTVSHGEAGGLSGDAPSDRTFGEGHPKDPPQDALATRQPPGDDGSKLSPVLKSVSDDQLITARTKCGTSSEESSTVNIEFPSTFGTVCDWSLQKANNHITALRDQTQLISIPDGKVLCGVKLDRGSQSFWYDDFIFFTFHDYVLASGQYYEHELLAMGLEKKGDLILFDKSKVIGKGPYNSTLNQRTSAICPHTGSCSIPKSDQPDSILQIHAPESWFSLMPIEDLRNQEYAFKVWLTGQKHDTDCQHSGLAFDATITYADLQP